MKKLFRGIQAMLDAGFWKTILVLIALIASCALVDVVLGREGEAYVGVVLAATLLYLAIRFTRHFVRFFLRAGPSLRMFTLLAVIGIFHVLGLISFFTVPFGFETPRNLLSEAFEVEIWIFPATFASIWALASLLVVLHFTRWSETRTVRLLSLGAFAVLVAMAVGTMQLALPALPLYQSFGADLPGPTLLFLDAYWTLLLIPAAALVAVGVVFLSADALGRSARFASAGLIALLVMANASLFAGLGSLYLPFFKMCGMPEMTTGFTRLHAAASLGREASVRRQLALGARLDSKSRHAGQALHIAASRGHLGMAALLLDRGADVNAVDDLGKTPLDRAYDNKQTRVADLLAGRGGVRSTKESRQGTVERVKAQTTASREERLGSCSV